MLAGVGFMGYSLCIHTNSIHTCTHAVLHFVYLYYCSGDALFLIATPQERGEDILTVQHHIAGGITQ